MKNQTFFHISNNAITNKKLVKEAFEGLKDGRYLLTLESHNNRSNDQNKYYWSGVIPLVKEGLKEIGYREITTKEQTHDLMKTMFLKKNIVNEITGEVLESIGSTTDLSTIEFSEYIDRIAQFSAEYLSIEILPPNTQVPMFAIYDQDLKDRETFLKTIPESGIDHLTDEGELIKIYKPSKTSTSSYKVTLAR